LKNERNRKVFWIRQVFHSMEFRIISVSFAEIGRKMDCFSGAKIIEYHFGDGLF